MKVTIADGTVLEGSVTEIQSFVDRFTKKEEVKYGTTIEFVNVLSINKSYDHVETGRFWGANELKSILTEVTFELEILLKSGSFMRTNLSVPKAIFDQIDKKKMTITDYVKEMFR